MYIKNRYRRGKSPHSFTYLFIDEAGQATETQTLVPIAGLLEQGGQVVRFLMKLLFLAKFLVCSSHV